MKRVCYSTQRRRVQEAHNDLIANGTIAVVSAGPCGPHPVTADGPRQPTTPAGCPRAVHSSFQCMPASTRCAQLPQLGSMFTGKRRPHGASPARRLFGASVA